MEGPRRCLLRRRALAGAGLAALVLAWQACRLPAPGPEPIVVTSASLTLAWDPPRFVLPGELSVAAYRLYVRVHGTAAWTQIAEVPASETSCTVSHLRLGNGSFDFSVRSVDGLGRVSVPHNSSDGNASPVGGWYVIWKTTP